MLESTRGYEQQSALFLLQLGYPAVVISDRILLAKPAATAFQSQ